MILVFITAFLAVCGADKLDRTYLPPPSAQTAGGSPGAIQAPFPTIKTQGSNNQGLGGLPKGSFENEYDGVVVDAAAAGSRTSEPGSSGLGGPRISYGSTNSKVGEAAFKVSQANQGFNRQAQPVQGQASQGVNDQSAALQGQPIQSFSGPFQGASPGQFQGFAQSPQFSNTEPQRPERPQAGRDRTANIIRYESDVDTDKFNYAFETDNGIIAEENGVDNNGIQAQGGFSYTGDDGQVYSVSYIADDRGYRPMGSHLPTPPPIPEEILKALEKNAQDEAAGIIDDGSYNAQKYNAGSGYTQSENDSGQYNGGTTNFNNRPGLSGSSGSFNNQNNYAQNSNQPLNPAFSPDSTSNTFQQFGQSSQSSQPGNNFAFNNEYSQSNRFQNGRPNSLQVPSNIFDKQVDASAQAEDQGQSTFNKPEPTNHVPDFGSAGNRRPGFGNFNQNRPSGSFAQTASQNFQQNRQPFGKPQKTEALQTAFQQTTSADADANDNIELLSTEQPAQTALNQQRPTGFNSFSGSFSGFNNEYLPPSNAFQQNKRPQASSISSSAAGQAGTAFQSNQFGSISRPQNVFKQPGQQFADFQQKPQIPSRFSSSFGQSSSSQSSNNELNKAPTAQPDTTLTTPFETSPNQDATTISDFVFSGPSRVEAEAQKEQLSNLQPSPSFPSSTFASSFASSQQGFSTYPQQNSQITEQNRFAESFGYNANTFSQNRPLPGSPSSSSISRPSFDQYQGSDDSYYYNQPAQSFNTPSQNQGGRFPGAPSNRLNGPSGSNFQTQQDDVPSTTVTYPRPPTVAPTVPTSSTQKDLGLNPFPQFGGVTDATASPFMSDSSSNAQGQGNVPQRQRPNAQQNFGQSFNKPEESKEEPAISSQQYEGEIYEYNKPATTLSAQPEKETTNKASNSFASTTQAQYQSRPQFGQSQSAKPQQPQSSSQLVSQVPQSRPTSVQQQSSATKPPCCKRPPGKPSIFSVGSSGSQNLVSLELPKEEYTQQDTESLGFGNSQASSSNFAGTSENFGGPRQPPSFDSETGYHY